MLYFTHNYIYDFTKCCILKSYQCVFLRTLTTIFSNIRYKVFIARYLASSAISKMYNEPYLEDLVVVGEPDVVGLEVQVDALWPGVPVHLYGEDVLCPGGQL